MSNSFRIIISIFAHLIFGTVLCSEELGEISKKIESLLEERLAVEYKKAITDTSMVYIRNLATFINYDDKNFQDIFPTPPKIIYTNFSVTINYDLTIVHTLDDDKDITIERKNLVSLITHDTLILSRKKEDDTFTFDEPLRGKVEATLGDLFEYKVIRLLFKEYTDMSEIFNEIFEQHLLHTLSKYPKTPLMINFEYLASYIEIKGIVNLKCCSYFEVYKASISKISYSHIKKNSFDSGDFFNVGMTLTYWKKDMKKTVNIVSERVRFTRTQALFFNISPSERLFGLIVNNVFDLAFETFEWLIE